MSKRPTKYLISLFALLLVSLGSSLTTAAQPIGSLTVSFIDVGQGDAALLKTSDGEHILIDGGPQSAGPAVVNFLQEQDVDTIDVVVMSHAHEDHIGGLIDVLQSSVSVGAVVYNGLPCSTTTCSAVWSEMQTRGLTPTPAVAGQNHSWGTLSGEVLNPQTTPRADQNEDSVVMLVVYGKSRFLFTGDIGTTTESTILTEGMDVSADVLKVAHHGSRYSSSAAFLDQVQATVAVISVGADNTYGHPAEETLARLQGAGARIFRTDQDGTVTITSDGHTIQYGGIGYVTFLPLVMNNPASGVTPEPPPMPGTNQVCSQIGDAQICGSVSSATPAQYTNVTVYGRLLVNGEGRTGQTMTAAWHYKSTTSTCDGVTDVDGFATCSRNIGRASTGYQVNVDVEIDGYTMTTWFTPQ